MNRQSLNSLINSTVSITSHAVSPTNALAEAGERDYDGMGAPMDKRAASRGKLVNPVSAYTGDPEKAVSADEQQGVGFANIVQHTQNRTLTTDYAFGDVVVTYADDPAAMVSLVAVPVNGKIYTRARVIDQKQNPHVYYALGRPDSIHQERSGHGNLYLVAPGTKWFGISTLRTIAERRKFTTQTDKEHLFAQEGREDLEDALDTVNALLVDVGINPKMGIASAEEAKRLNSPLFQLLSKVRRINPIKDSKGNVFAFNLKSAHKPDEDEYALITNEDWLAGRTDIDEITKQHTIDGLRRAVYSHGGNGLLNSQDGLRYGFFMDELGNLSEGFQVFVPGTTHLLAPIDAYVAQAANLEAAARTAKPHEQSDIASKIRQETVRRLVNAYRDSHNQSHNGVIALNSLDVETAGIENLSGKVFVTPILVRAAAMEARYMKERERPHMEPGEHFAFNRFSTDLMTKAKDSRTVMQGIIKDSIEHTKLNRDDIGNKARYGWKLAAILPAYNPKEAGLTLGNASATRLKGWTMLSDHKADPETVFSDTAMPHTRTSTHFILIPPGTDKAVINDVIQKRSPRFTLYANGEQMLLSNFVDLTYDKDTDTRVSIIGGNSGKEYSVAEVWRAAKTYQTDDETDAQEKRRNFGFSDVRPGKVSSVVDKAELDLIKYMGIMRTKGDDYKNVTDKLSNLYRKIFHDNEDRTEIAETLYQLGEVSYKDSTGRKASFVFGPSGALYRVMGLAGDGKRRMIEEVPIRAFDSDSVYMDLLSRLSDVANGKNRHTKPLHGNFAAFAVSSEHTRTFNTWYDDLTRHAAEIQGQLHGSDLQGVATYSKLVDLMDSETLFNPKVSKPGYAGRLKDKDVRRMQLRWVEGMDDGAKEKLTRETQENLSEHLRARFGKMYARTAAFQSEYAMDPAVLTQLQTEMDERMQKSLEALRGNARDWPQVEQMFAMVVAQDKGSDRMIKSLYEIERDERGPTMVSRAIKAINGVITRMYQKFVESFKSVFDLMNPATILTNLGSAMMDSIGEAAHVFVSLMFTNFVDKHFVNAPVAKNFAIGQLQNFDVKVLKTHERKTVNAIIGNPLVTHKTEPQRIKMERLNRKLEVYPGWANLEPVEAEQAKRVFEWPQLIVRNDDMADGKFYLAYKVRSEDDFAELSNVAGEGKMSFDSLRKQDNLDKWWRHVGSRFLNPASLLDKETNNDYGKTIEQEMQGMEAHRFVSIEAGNVLIRMDVRQLGNETPQTVFGTLKQARLAQYKMQDYVDKKTRDDAKTAAAKYDTQTETLFGKLTGKGASKYNGSGRSDTNADDLRDDERTDSLQDEQYGD